ncbi:MAG: hypothetical protein EHM23_26095 [Acidobacteria bacterium]|nr:MAG: hypothetical protein EHM23_26095 [Acidobacteriota bacterium]
MKNASLRLIGLILVVFLIFDVAAAQGWQKFVSRDRSFSFHYPRGWKASETDSAVEITNQTTNEVLLVVAIPFDAAKTPRQLAEAMVEIFRTGMPDIRASEWKSTPETRESGVHFRVKYTEEGRKYDSNVMVVKGDGQALWFSFSAPLTGYDPQRAVELLEKVVSSMAEGSASLPPESPATPAPGRAPAKAEISTEKNAKAFLFVLEFALGAPLTVSQERVILTELQDGWKKESPEELRKYDQYPKLVPVILKLGQAQLEGVRGELEGAVRQWINDYRGKSESVNIIEAELKRRGRVLIAGEPPLTEMAASAYSEITAYSELLQANPEADPEDIDESTVSEIRRQLKQQWSAFSKADRELIGTTPGLWICQRTLLGHGSAPERDRTRAQIKRLSAARGQASGSGTLSAKDRETSRALANKMIEHNVLMNIQQQTFNTYMWSRGFNYHPTYGKMW